MSRRKLSILACIVQEQIREVVGLRHQMAQSEQSLDEARKVSKERALISPLSAHFISGATSMYHQGSHHCNIVLDCMDPA